MERTKKSPRSRNSRPAGERILLAYREHLMEEGRPPVSVYKFAIDHGISEQDFYREYGSFETLDKKLWQELIEQTIARLKHDETYPEFSCREKVLAFYFTLTEELKARRSLYRYYLDLPPRLQLVPGFLQGFKPVFDTFVSGILEEGMLTGEIAQRPVLDKQYPHLFGMHLLFILHFWKDDGSPGLEHTDAAIEKSVNLAFDLIAKGTVDSLIDFGKFLYQTKKA
jgi:hypothetical protein